MKKSTLGPHDERLSKLALEQLDDAIHGRPTTTYKKVEFPAPATSQEAKAARKAVKLSQPAFAVALGVSPSTVRSWEQGQRTPDGVASKVLKALKTTPKLLSVLAKVR